MTKYHNTERPECIERIRAEARGLKADSGTTGTVSSAKAPLQNTHFQ